MKTLIKNGLIYDGTGAPAYNGHILLRDDRIADIFALPTEELPPADFIIDANGRAVTPGFIDTHRHNDLAAVTDSDFGEIELAQGITTVVCGNCGLAPVPSSPETRQELLDFIEPCLGAMEQPFSSDTVSSYIRYLSSNALPLNTAVLAATGAITVAAKGFGSAAFTPEQLKKALFFIDDAMEAGAFGLSCGIMYTPECYTREEEFVAMAKEAGKYGGYFTCHIRGEGNSLVPSVEEVIRIGEKAGVPVNISHFKATGVTNWGRLLPQAIDVIEQARAKGLDVTVDAYPYTGGSTTILSLIPPTVPLDGLDSPAGYELLRREISREHAGWDNMVLSIGWERIIISSVHSSGLRQFTGKSLAEAAQLLYCDPAEALCRLTAANNGKVGVILMSMSQQDVDTVLRLPYASVISDSLYGGGDCPHPRLYGSFPKILREYVRERKIFTLEEAIRKMTYLPAKRLGLPERGTLKAGNMADLCIFDPHRVCDAATFEQPRQLARGMDYVLVNGSVAYRDNGQPGARKGKTLLHKA